MRHRRAVILVFLPFVAGFYLSYLFRTINALIADKLVSDLMLTAADLGLLTSVYFLTFAGMQLPLGVWLDRYGPRHVQAILLAVAAVGSAVFGLAQHFAPLVLGRALMGAGVAGALTAGLKAIVMWFPKEHVALINGWFVSVGALGAVTATAPTEWLLPALGWRGLFLVLAPATCLCEIVIFFVVPQAHPAHYGTRGAAAPLAGLKTIYSDPRFWRVAPLSASCIGTSWALPGLWAASWLTDVESLDRSGVVRHLFVMAVGLCVAALGLGVVAHRLRRCGVHAQTVLVVTAIVFMAAQSALVLRLPLPSYLLWSIMAGVGAATVLSYAILAEHFPKEMTGRANGALNTLHFGSAFIVQWGTGVVVQQWTSHDGHYPAIAYQVALSINLALQVIALFWFAWSERLGAWRVSRLQARSRPYLWGAVRIAPVTIETKLARVRDGQLRTVLAQAANWRLAALGSALLCGLLSLSFGMLAGRAGAVGVQNNIPSDSQIAYILARFIENVRSLSNDPVVVRRSWLSAYAYVTGPGARVVDEYAREVEPLAMVGMRMVSVEVTSVERVSSRSFTIRWVEAFHENGLRMTTDEFTGVLAVRFVAPGSSETIMANPFGLQIDAIEWSGRTKPSRSN